MKKITEREQNTKQAPLSVVERQFLVGKGGRIIEQMVRVGTSNCKAFIDQLTFIVHLDALSTIDNILTYSTLKKDFYQNTDCADLLNHFVGIMSEQLQDIFGFGVSAQRDKGLNFYTNSYQLGTKECNYGYVCVGGNRHTMCVSLTATGLLAAKEGWEKRLYDFAKSMKSDFHFTRVDITRDFYHGEYNVQSMLNDYYAEKFKIKGAMVQPLLDKAGKDWHNKTNYGRTIYIGSRESSRYLRGYEKGKQLGDEKSRWFRVELELRNRDLVIPLEVLLHCGDYLTMYPAFAENAYFSDTTPTRIYNKKRTLQLEIAHSIKYLLLQGGKTVNWLFHLGKSDAEIGEMFRHYLYKYRTDPNHVPKGLNMGQYMAEKLDITYFERDRAYSIYYSANDEFAF